ncbi:MAG: ester cyclase [Candidatus Limnocylindria bacterium]
MTNAETVRLYWEVCWNQRAVERLAEVFHDPYVHGRTSLTPADHAAIVRETVAAFPDLEVRLDELEDLGATVVTRTRFVGTHRGPIFGLGPTGRSMEAPSLDVYFFRDGRVARLWHLFDHLPILRGIGAEIRIGDEVADLT